MRGGLLGVADPPLDVVELEEPPAVRLGTLVGVGRPDGSLRHLALLSSEDWGGTAGPGRNQLPSPPSVLILCLAAGPGWFE